MQCGLFYFSVGFLTNSWLLECSSILVSSLNVVLFQASASHRFYLFVQLNVAIKWFLFNASFLTEMLLFSLCFRRMCLVISTDTKFDKFTSIHHLPVVFFYYPDEFLFFILWWSHLRATISWLIWKDFSDLIFEEDFQNSKFFSYCLQFCIFHHIHYLYLVSNFHHNFKQWKTTGIHCTNFHYM